MRGLKGADLFTAMRIVRNAGIQDEVQKIALDIADGKKVTQQQAGAQLIIACVCGCATERAEHEIWRFLGDLTEQKPEDLKNMELDKLMDVVEELSTHISKYDFANFFTRLSRLISVKSLS